jgi:hypothetical protein
MSLEGDCHVLEVTPNLELLVPFGASLERFCHELDSKFSLKLASNFGGT